MSITRAFTTRRVKQSLQLGESVDSSPQRSNTARARAGSIRNKISAPVELIHTTNMLSYQAPDIYPKSDSPTASSTKSEDDISDAALTAASSPPTSPDMPQEPFSPDRASSSYFATSSRPAAVAAKKSEPPVIPQRAPSHTKTGNYDTLTRHRSTSRLSEQSTRTVSSKASFSFSRSSSTSTSTSATSHVSTPPTPKHTSAKASFVSAGSSSPVSNLTAPPPVQYQHKKEYSESQHPFGQELAQVTELAEEYGFKERLDVVGEEEQELASLGLFKFSAEDYLSEIRDIFTCFFVEPRPAAAMWI